MGGKVEITLPGAAIYVPGQTQKITVTVSDPAQRTWGFQLTARVQSTNAQTGDLNPADASTLVVCADDSIKSTTCPAAFNTQFIEHSGPKSGTGSGTFTFNWTAPATNVGTVIFYAAGNAANGNGADTGDHIYTTTQQLTASAAANTPTVNTGGVVPVGSKTSTIATGSWVEIYGTNLSTTSRFWNVATEIVNGNFPTSLDGVSVKLNGKPAYVYFISPGQIDVQAPDDTATGPVSVTVTTSAGTSSAGSVTLSKYAPSVLLFDLKHPAAQIFTAAALLLLGPPNTFPFTTRGAKPGETIILYGTGFGPTKTPVPSGQVFSGAAETSTAVTMTIGGIPTSVKFAGVNGQNGVYQLNVEVPSNVPSGEQPLVVSVGGVQAQTGLVITVQ